ncbi:MAG: DUF5674 family protein [Candidatus Pacebacteria bacterium]|nr:DUF5674 family protein [Candidatus Paceibacterota bacterium]
MNIQIVRDIITRKDAQEIAKEFYDTMIKGVVDIERGIIAIGGEYHIDANVVLIEAGSIQKDIWGFNLLFDKTGDEAIEYTSLINIRPQAGNRGMEVEDADLRLKMKKIIEKKII